MRREPTPYTPSPDEWAALGARLFGLEEHEPVPRRQVAGPDERVPIELTYVQIGLVLGALAHTQLNVHGDKSELVQREIHQLRREINEQVQATVKTHV
jgi:hypothetical protein